MDLGLRTDFCLTAPPHGLGRSPQDIAQIVEDHKDPKTIAEKVKPLAEHGGDRKSEEGKSTLCHNVEQQGTDSTLKIRRSTKEYLTRRIARDCPAVLEDMKAGKYPRQQTTKLDAFRKKVEKERAKRRQAEAGKSASPGKPAPKGKEPVPTVSNKKNQARDTVGKKVGTSGKTVRPYALIQSSRSMLASLRMRRKRLTSMSPL